ncbi:uncharacterized protein LOC127010685 [Drosophila biarmipes]|uniref:uncharacterized protein LOC127010685 n=1 Tax=Drosophila biarmipes TaxID=125945 RepID=UPI0021CC7E58|nr:uncharacterized protein LOC127010685 [Drosophila biarmipes]
MHTLYITCLLVALLGYVMGANVRCTQKGGVSGSCKKLIKGYMYSAPKRSCFSLLLKGCETYGKFFDTKSDCGECLI